MNRDSNKQSAIILAVIGILPVVWLGLLIAPSVKGGLPEILPSLLTAFNDPFHIELCGDSLKTVLVHIDGKTYPSDRVPILKEVGSFIEAPAFYGNLSGEENLEIIRKILGLPKSCVDDALELVGLTEFRKRLAKKYSLGMKQRLGLAGALIGRPPILILDEPTNGLDPVGIHEIRTLIRSLPQKYDCTVLVSSHLLPEVELMADDIGILNHGHLLFEGTKEELKTNARAAGFPTDNLEDTFLAMIDEDNRRRGGTV